MKIKLAIIEQDRGYLNRIVSVFSTKYADKFEVYSFSDLEVAIETIRTTRIDVLLASESLEINTALLPSRCSFAYLVDSSDVETLNNQRTICKFQKADLIYKQILSIYAEKAGSMTGLKMADEDCRFIAFASPSGGAGSSTVAAACAMHLAAQGKKTLYLSIEPFGSSDVFFAGEGNFTMSDVVYALKSKKTNLAMKLESCVKQDSNGVFFFSQSQIALDMLELSTEDILRLLSEIKITGAYNYVILDADFGIDKAHLDMFRQAHAVVVVGDGSDVSNMKIFRAYNALTTKEQGADVTVSGRMLLIYNKFSNKTGKALEGIELRSIGGAPRYEHATTAQVLEQLSLLNVFDKIID